MSALASALAALADRRDLSADEAYAATLELLDGRAAEAVSAAFLTALRVKGEQPDELAGAVRAVRQRMTPLEVPARLRPLLDTCGTGGDGANTVNVSTAAAIVVAACGVRVAKHGNRSASGNSGSAEVLTELGVNIEAEPPALLRCLEDVGIAFLFAPRFHPALRALAPVRKQLPFRTLFNLIGPLANPARPEYQLIGVPRCQTVLLVTAALADLDWPDGGRAAVVCGSDRFDEVTPFATTTVGWTGAEDSRIGLESWEPSDFGLGAIDPDALRVSGSADSASRIRALLAGERGPVRDLVLANAAAALHVAGCAPTMAEGVACAAGAIESGEAARLLDRWGHATRC